MKMWSRAGAVTVATFFLATSAWGQQRKITPEDYYVLRTVSDPQLSPNGKLVAYVVGTTDQKQNKRHSDIWLADVDGSREPRQLTESPEISSSPRWSPDGRAIAFLSARPSSQDGKAIKEQVQLLSLQGGEAHALTSLKNGVESFSWSPDGTRLVCVSTRGPQDATPEDPERSDSRHYVHPTYKLDGMGFFDGRRQHLWVVDVKSGSGKQITEGDDWNDTDPQWSPDGMRIAFVSDRSGHFLEDVSYNGSEVWVIGAGGGTPVKVSDGEGADGAPRWSPDGAWIAYFGGQIEEEPRRLLLAPSTGDAKPKELAKDLDIQVRGLEWGDRGRALYFLSNVRGEVHVFRTDVRSGKLSQVTSGERFLHAMKTNDESNSLAYTASGFQHTGDLYVAHLDGSQERQITNLNQAWLKQVQIRPVERMSYIVDDGFSVDGFLVRPVGWQEGKKYPMILVIHGGPEGMFGMNWMIQVQIFAAHGWAVFYTNPRGSTGYGTKFMQAVVKEWGGKVYTDIMNGVDAILKQNPWIDGDRLGVTGCSFGGSMTNWIVSHTTRFKAAVPMCSVSDYVSDEGTRDAYYGHAHDFGGDLYQNFDLYWKYSPIRYAMNVKTPTLILHGEADQLVPLEQAEQWFRALHHFHVPSELVIFPRESHGGLSNGEPRHVVEVMRWQTYWFERYLDGNAGALSPDAVKKETNSPGRDQHGSP